MKATSGARKPALLLLLCSAVALLAGGCGTPAVEEGGRWHPPVPTAAGATPEPRLATETPSYFLRRKDVVLFLGNSLTVRAQPAINALVHDLQEKYPALAAGEDRVTFVTSGVDGEQAVRGAVRLKDLLQKYKPTVCVVWYGTCEVTFQKEPQFTPALRDIVRQLKAAHVAVTIVSPPPPSAKNWRHAPAYPVDRFVENLPQMAAQAGALARKQQVCFADVYAALRDFAAPGDAEFTTDGIHLNEAGYQVTAAELQRAWGFGQPLCE